MTGLLALAVGLGLVLSLLLSEALGVAAAGMVVPGYVALSLTRPVELACLLVASLLTYGAIRVLGSFIILYGRRRTAFAILIGYLLGALIGYAGARLAPGLAEGDRAVIGFVIPGLVALWMDRQGVVETLSSLTVCSVLVRLLLLLFFGSEVPT
jgi:poly-gamma-glutamate biosynthesis protein PgsC/CapC